MFSKHLFIQKYENNCFLNILDHVSPLIVSCTINFGYFTKVSAKVVLIHASLFPSFVPIFKGSIELIFIIFVLWSRFI